MRIGLEQALDSAASCACICYCIVCTCKPSGGIRLYHRLHRPSTCALEHALDTWWQADAQPAPLGRAQRKIRRGRAPSAPRSVDWSRHAFFKSSRHAFFKAKVNAPTRTAPTPAPNSIQFNQNAQGETVTQRTPSGAQQNPRPRHKRAHADLLFRTVPTKGTPDVKQDATTTPTVGLSSSARTPHLTC